MKMLLTSQRINCYDDDDGCVIIDVFMMRFPIDFIILDDGNGIVVEMTRLAACYCLIY